MKVLFISNSLNIHQAIFWDCFVANSDVSLVFLETDPTDNGIKEKCQRGYTMLSSKINNCDVNLFMNSFDVIIVGHCSDKRFFNFPKDKIIIHCSEHFWKKINTPISLCKRILKMIILKKRYKKVKNLFVFATSSRLFNELSAIKLNFKACYKFGYFPPVNEELDLSCKNDKSIIYAGRLIKCKRPQRSLFLLKKLQENDASYSLSYIGKGELENRLKKKAKKINNVSFGPYISHEELLLKFKQSSIFCFSSNREEGWGAVLNETLSSGCIVFADEAAGSTKYLIKNVFPVPANPDNVKTIPCKSSTVAVVVVFSQILEYQSFISFLADSC